MKRPGLGWMILALVATGCDDGFAPLTGTVTFQHQPLAAGTIAFFPAGGGPPGYCSIVDGKYAARTGNRSGLKPGEYRVTVMAHGSAAPQQGQIPMGPPLLTPQRYAARESSPLRCVVPASNHTFNIAVEDP